MAFSHPLTIRQGETFRLEVTVINPSTGDPADLTGITAAAQVRRRFDSPHTQLDFTIENGETDGVLTLSATAEETAAMTMTAGEGYWDLEITDDDEVIRLVEGRIYFFPEVTR